LSFSISTTCISAHIMAIIYMKDCCNRYWRHAHEEGY
jgi:hypothetical protein